MCDAGISVTARDMAEGAPGALHRRVIFREVLLSPSLAAVPASKLGYHQVSLVWGLSQNCRAHQSTTVFAGHVLPRLAGLPAAIGPAPAAGPMAPSVGADGRNAVPKSQRQWASHPHSLMYA